MPSKNDFPFETTAKSKMAPDGQSNSTTTSTNPNSQPNDFHIQMTQGDVTAQDGDATTALNNAARGSKIDVTSRTQGNDVAARASLAEGKEKEDTMSRHGHWLRAHSTNLRYSLTSFPPIPVSLFIALQHLLVSLASALTVSSVISDSLCADPGHPIRARLLTTTLFMSGLATIMQTLLGVRLPVFQGASSSFLVPLLALNNIPGWHCPAPYGSIQHPHGAANSTSAPNDTRVGEADSTDNFTIEDKLQQLSGSLMVSSLVEILIGGCGLIRPLLRRIGPLTVAPTIGLIGLSLFKLPSDYASLNPGIALGSALLVILFSLYMSKVQAPIPSCKKGQKPTRFPIFQLLPILLAMMLMWLLCLVMTLTNVFPDDQDHPYYYSRTDSKSNIIRETPWFQITYPGQFGLPSFSLAAFIGFTAAICASFVESVGDYFATAKCCHVMPPPDHAISRGILVEGIASFLSGTVGAAHATTSYSQNISLLRLTKTVSRWVLVLAGALLILFSLIGKIGATLTTMPAPILGGIFIVVLGMLSILGLSCLEYADMTSDRNLIVTGVALMSGLAVPNFIDKYGYMLDTGNPAADQVIRVVLGTPMFLGGIVALILDNTVPGTEEERGIKAWREAHASPDDENYEFVSSVSDDDDDDEVGGDDGKAKHDAPSILKPTSADVSTSKTRTMEDKDVTMNNTASVPSTNNSNKTTKGFEMNGTDQQASEATSSTAQPKLIHATSFASSRASAGTGHASLAKVLSNRSMREVCETPPSEDDVYAFAILKGRLTGRFWRFLRFLPPNAYTRRQSVVSSTSRRQSETDKSAKLPGDSSVMLDRLEAFKTV